MDKVNFNCRKSRGITRGNEKTKNLCSSLGKLLGEFVEWPCHKIASDVEKDENSYEDKEEEEEEEKDKQDYFIRVNRGFHCEASESRVEYRKSAGNLLARAEDTRQDFYRFISRDDRSENRREYVHYRVVTRTISLSLESQQSNSEQVDPCYYSSQCYSRTDEEKIDKEELQACRVRDECGETRQRSWTSLRRERKLEYLEALDGKRRQQVRESQGMQRSEEFARRLDNGRIEAGLTEVSTSRRVRIESADRALLRNGETVGETLIYVSEAVFRRVVSLDLVYRKTPSAAPEHFIVA